MLTITREKYQQLYNEQQRSMKIVKAVGIAAPVIAVLILLFSHSVAASFFGIVLCVAPLIYIYKLREKLIPPGHGNNVKDVMNVMKYDLCSDKLVELIVRKINQTSEFCERTRLTILLADVYAMRGQINDSINVLYSVDKNMFRRYPAVGLSYFQDLISLYVQYEDYDNARAAFADAESFIAEYYDKNYIYCMTAVELLINANIAYGNYTDALILQTIQNDISRQYESSDTNKQTAGTPLQNFITGERYLATALIYYNLGDMQQAAKFVDMGGPMLANVPHEVERANTLSRKIREHGND